MKKDGLIFFMLLAITPLILLKKHDYGFHTPKVIFFWGEREDPSLLSCSIISLKHLILLILNYFCTEICTV